MVKALIGTSLRTYSVVYIQYDGPQSIEELSKNIVNWVSSSSIRELTRNGHITNLGSGFEGTKWKRSENGVKYRDVHSIALTSKEDFEKLMTRSLPSIKRDQFKKESDEYNANLPSGKRKKSPKLCHYTDDGFRPDVLFLCTSILNNTAIQWSEYTSKKTGWTILKTLQDQAEKESPKKKS